MSRLLPRRFALALFLAMAGLAARAATAAAESAAPANVIAFGFFGDQDVFQSEAQKAAAIVAARYGHGGAVIVRANVGARRAAMIDDLRAAIDSVGRRPGGADEVLFLILSSHGSRAGIAVKSGAVTETLSPQDVGAMLDAAGIRRRVIIVSACYSGVFAEALASFRTVVITAADPDHTSFGCRSGAAWTYFGQAFFAEALPHARGLWEAFIEARSRIGQRETTERLTPSNPQMAGGADVVARLDGSPPPHGDYYNTLDGAPPARCELKAEPSQEFPDCEVFDGYVGGHFKGAFHLSGKRYIAAGGQCPASFVVGRQLGPNRIAADGAVFTLSPDCRDGARSTQ